MTIPFLAPSRCILLIGDDALHVYNAGKGGAVLLESVPWDHDRFQDHVAALIAEQARGRSVAILNDMTDQHFKGGQRVPKVGAMDQARVLANRLKMAFPNYPIRGALRVKETNTQSAKSGMPYLFAAVAVSDNIRKTMDAVSLSKAVIDGAFLLPVESADMVTALAEKAGQEDDEGAARWVVLIGQHSSGALRQVIVRDGQLAMTRMTPANPLGGDYELWARQVNQEFKATVSYLSRFGFSPEEGVDVILIGHPEAGQALNRMIDLPCRFFSFTANQAATLLKLNLSRVGNAVYAADPLHVAWAGSKPRFALPLSTGFLEKVQAVRQGARLAAVVLVLGMLFLGGQFLTGVQKTMLLGGDLKQKKMQLSQVEGEYQAEVARLKEMGIDVGLVQGVVSVYENMEAGRMKTLPLVLGVREAMGSELRLDSVRLTQLEPKIKTGGFDGGFQGGIDKPQDRPFEMLLKFGFPSTMDPEVAVKEVDSFKKRLQDRFPSYEVVIERNVIGLDYSAEFSGATGISAEDVSEEDYVSEIKIKGYAQ